MFDKTRLSRVTSRLQAFYHNQDGQGTTEYAILVGVLVVIAIVAIIAFKGKSLSYGMQLQQELTHCDVHEKAFSEYLLLHALFSQR